MLPKKNRIPDLHTHHIDILRLQNDEIFLILQCRDRRFLPTEDFHNLLNFVRYFIRINDCIRNPVFR